MHSIAANVNTSLATVCASSTPSIAATCSTAASVNILPATVYALSTNNNRPPVFDVVKQTLSNSSFYVAHCNVNGLLGSILPKHTLDAGSHFKIDFLRQIMAANLAPPVLCISESKLNEHIDDGEITINNYSAFCKDRSRRGRDIVTYCLSCLQPKHLLEDFSSCVEFVAFKIVSQKTVPMIFCCIYRPPNSKPTWVNDLNIILNHLSYYSLPITLIGDFNIDLLDDNRFADEFKINFCFDQLIKFATRVTTKSSTLFEHIYMNSYLPVQAGVFSLGLTNHYAIYCHFK